jgi:hypothetical protein
MATPTWPTRERPLLEAINDRATPAGGPKWEELVSATELSEADVQFGLRYLFENGWITGQDVSSNTRGGL